MPEIALEPQFGIDGNEPSLAGKMYAMARVEDDSEVGSARLLAEIEKRPPQHVEASVSNVHHFEAQSAQRSADQCRVLFRVGERRSVRVGGVADHQRDPIFRSDARWKHSRCANQ